MQPRSQQRAAITNQTWSKDYWQILTALETALAARATAPPATQTQGHLSGQQSALLCVYERAQQTVSYLYLLMLIFAMWFVCVVLGKMLVLYASYQNSNPTKIVSEKNSVDRTKLREGVCVLSQINRPCRFFVLENYIPCGHKRYYTAMQ